MKTRIMILVEADNNNIVYRDIVSIVKKEIISYFGTRNARDLSPSDASVMIESDVTQDDIDALYKIIDHSSICLLAFRAWDISDRITGNIIDLS